MKYTPNLILKLPENHENVLVDDLNENFKTIDTEIAKITDEETGVQAQLTTHLDEKATETKLGHVMIGNGISFDENGVISHPTSAGNKHIPSGGKEGQVLGFGGSSGTSKWVDVEVWEKITEVVLASNTAIIEFSNLNLQDYSQLRIMAKVKGTQSTGNSFIRLTCNGDTGNNYDKHEMRGYGTSTTSYSRQIGASDYGVAGAPNSGEQFAPLNMLITNDASHYKYLQTLTSVVEAGLWFSACTWRKYDYLTSLTLGVVSASFRQGSTFELWGVKR